MKLWVCGVALCAAGCGEVSSGEDAPMVDHDAASDATVPPDAPPPDACVPSIRVSVQFTITNIVGSGTSSLDPTLNHPNGYIVTIPAGWTEERGIDAIDSTFTTTVKSSAFTFDFTGQDGDLLDTEVGAHLTRGLAFRDGLFDLKDSKRAYLYILPEDEHAHPYTSITCNNAPFTTDAQTNFPILADFTATGCTLYFYDFRPNTQRNLVADDATFELSYQACP